MLATAEATGQEHCCTLARPPGKWRECATTDCGPCFAQMRAKHDIYNSVYAGCAAGAVLAHSAGPKGMCLGCASFAAFSALIDKVMEHD